jgi:tRNA A-37 threonylcarbamoyl transferase component Bud32
MGQVFKARNWKLGRVAALKVIRKERLANEDAVRRFRREIRAAGQLAHPNIVLAYDADEVNGTHFFVMEYVAGRDLARVVKEQGPLPLATACDCVRQAALGLQHAHERGLVHRDIKPHNLLLTAQGVVKILDLGLAQLGTFTADEESGGTLTQEGLVMGTLDYIAPEQVNNSHTVDIRADLYSLGCTFYHLLTGWPPFPACRPVEKLYKHRYEEPLPIERRRPEVPPALAAVVRRLLAKRPSDRYQTPAELAAVLATGALTTGAPVASHDRGWVTPAGPADGGETAPTVLVRGQRAVPGHGGGEPAGETAPTGFTDLGLDAAAARPAPSAHLRQRRERRRLWLLGGVGLLLLSLGAAALSSLFLGRDPLPVEEPVSGTPGTPAPRGPRPRGPDRKIPAHDAVGARVTIVPDRPGRLGPGAAGLADGLLAEGDEAGSAGWVGWERGAGPVQVTLDLARPTKVTKLGAHFLRARGVTLPVEVAFAVSEDGKEFRTVATLSERDGLGQRGWYTAALEAVTARRVRVSATPGADWLYLDEVAVNPLPEAPPFRHAALGRPVTLASPPALYEAPGVQGLTDGFVGRSPDFLNLQWLGIEGRDLDASIDLGRVLDVREVGAHFLQDVRVGIRIPPAMDVLISGDGKEFRKVATVKPDPDERPVYMVTLSARLDGVTARFVRVVARTHGLWLFADEVFVNPEPVEGKEPPFRGINGGDTGA